MKAKNIGFKVNPPKKRCSDTKCPFHGSLKVRGRIFTGTIIASRMHKTANVEWARKINLPKYERFAKKRTRIKAHNPDCIKADQGDIVRIMECRPLSKTVNFVIIENLGKEKGFAQRMESLEESKAGFRPEEEQERKPEIKENKEQE
ncbi:30S ribosomal protein S17 [Candidatus Woesearchaeota archaeon]|nr:30S ribosomal protein S17 [Candidatus Woesearchaeota archaeon]